MKPIPVPLTQFGSSGVPMRIVDAIEGDWYVLEVVPNIYVPYFGWPYPTWKPVVHKNGVLQLDDTGIVYMPYYNAPLAYNQSTGEVRSAYGWLALTNVYEGEAPGRSGFAHYGSGKVALLNNMGIPVGGRVFFSKNGELRFRDYTIIRASGWTKRYWDEMASNGGPFDVPVAFAR